MTGALREWLAAVCCTALAVTAAQALTPEGTVRRVCGLIGGVLLALALLRPVMGADWQWLRLLPQEYTQALRQAGSTLATAGEEAAKAGIEEQAGAYISDKARELGGEVTARVQASIGEDGLLTLRQAELTGAYSAALAEWIAGELGIPAERQVWHEGKS